MLITRITPHAIITIVIVIFLHLVIFSSVKLLRSVSLPTITLRKVDTRFTLTCAHFNSLYPEQTVVANSKLRLQSTNDSNLPKIIKQQAIGLCINFNHNPDAHGNTLRSLLMYYTLIHQYVAIVTPLLFVNLSSANQAILEEYNVTALAPLKPHSNGHIRLNASDNFNGTLFHLSCPGSHYGYYQYLCTSLCAQLFQQVAQKQTNFKLRGVLYLPDDIFFNITLTLTTPYYYNLDEFWIQPAGMLIDASQVATIPAGWGWWHHNNNWNRFHQIFFGNQTFSNVLSTLYGPNRSMLVASADLAYIPTADNQLTTFVEIVDTIMTIFPGVFCELILNVLVDITSALCGHWPYQHDRRFFQSKVNRLNNVTHMRDLEEKQKILRARDPFNSSEYMRRPCLFNPDGGIWGDQRNSERLYRQAIFTNRSPFSNRTQDNRIDYIHPMKLSNNQTWQYKVWHEAMNAQIQQLEHYQKYCL